MITRQPTIREHSLDQARTAPHIKVNSSFAWPGCDKKRPALGSRIRRLNPGIRRSTVQAPSQQVLRAYRE